LALVQPLYHALRGCLGIGGVDPLLLAGSLFLVQSGSTCVPIINLARQSGPHLALDLVYLCEPAPLHLGQVVRPRVDIRSRRRGSTAEQYPNPARRLRRTRSPALDLSSRVTERHRRLLSPLGAEKPEENISKGRFEHDDEIRQQLLRYRILAATTLLLVPSHETEVIHQALDRLPADIAILIIEHDMSVVFRFADEIVVLAQGRVLARGSTAAISADPRVRAVYLGKSAV
jgi:hypothetical protein